MGFEEARPEYYEGLKIFQAHTNQQERLKFLLKTFWTLARNQKDFLPQPPFLWRDVGCGDGTFTQKALEALRESGFPPPVYEGIEPDSHFVSAARNRLAGEIGVKIVKGEGFDGTLSLCGPSDIISGFNALYFAKDLQAFGADLAGALKPTGLGLFIQNHLFTQRAGEAFIGADYQDYVASLPTEVFFPPVSKSGYALITGRVSEKDIAENESLSEQEKKNAIIVKKIIDSMGGISTETEAGQHVARLYEKRILSEDYGGPGRYVTDNFLLVLSLTAGNGGFQGNDEKNYERSSGRDCA